MRRLAMSVVMFGVVLAASGCIAANVSGNRFGANRDLIAVNDQVYVVDKTTGKVMTVDVSSAVPFVPESDSD